jgi:hypothetical protein
MQISLIFAARGNADLIGMVAPLPGNADLIHMGRPKVHNTSSIPEVSSEDPGGCHGELNVELYYNWTRYGGGSGDRVSYFSRVRTMVF